MCPKRLGNQLKLSFIPFFKGKMFIYSIILPLSQPFLNMFPCRGRQNDAKGTKIKTRCTLETAVELTSFCSSPPL